MRVSSFDLAVAYRIYPRVSQRPAIFADDKYKLAELCLRSFRESLGDLRVKLWALLDGCPPEYADLFRKYFPTESLELIHFDGIGNHGTFIRQIDLLLGQSASETVYFAEDDYFYLPGQFREMLDFMSAHPDVDFVTPYDHRDYYTLELHRHRNEIRVHGQRHWRTANSTCLTFLTRQQVLRDTQEVFRSYARGNLDFTLWLALTKMLPDRLRSITDFLIGQGVLRSWLISSQRFVLRQVLFGRRRSLWAPIPSIATHLESSGLAPVVDWQGRFLEGSPLTESSGLQDRKDSVG